MKTNNFNLFQISLTRTLLRGCTFILLCAVPMVAFSQSSILDKYTGSSSTSSSGSSTGSSAEGGESGSEAVSAQNQGAGSLQGDERFLRENREAGSFVGADREDATNTRGIQEGEGTGNRRITGTDNIDRWRQEQERQAQAARGAGRGQRPFRTQMVVDFKFKQLAAHSVSAKLQQRLAKSSAFRTPKPPTVSVQQRTAILRGEVPNQRARALALMYARLEPGISRVVDEMTLAPPKASKN